MSIPAVSFNQTQDTQSWAEFGTKIAVYSVVVCLPVIVFKAYQVCNSALRNYAQSWSNWSKFSDERESIKREIKRLVSLHGDSYNSASRIIGHRIQDLSNRDALGARDLGLKLQESMQHHATQEKIQFLNDIHSFMALLSGDENRVITIADLQKMEELSSKIDERYSGFTDLEKEDMHKDYTLFTTTWRDFGKKVVQARARLAESRPRRLILSNSILNNSNIDGLLPVNT